jgi:hypothetical protein
MMFAGRFILVSTAVRIGPEDIAHGEVFLCQCHELALTSWDPRCSSLPSYGRHAVPPAGRVRAGSSKPYPSGRRFADPTPSKVKSSRIGTDQEVCLDFITNPRVRCAIVYANIMIFLGQLTGVNAVIYYLSALLNFIGLNKKDSVFSSWFGGWRCLDARNDSRCLLHGKIRSSVLGQHHASPSSWLSSESATRFR